MILFKPYWQILENSSRKFFEISVFRGVTQTNFWKTYRVFFRNFNFWGISWTNFWKIHPPIFCEDLFSCCKISGHELDPRIDNWMSFPYIGSAHNPEICLRFRERINRNQFLGLFYGHFRIKKSPQVIMHNLATITGFHQKITLQFWLD